MSEMSYFARVLIIVFALAMVATSFIIGWWAKRKVTSAQDYFGSTGLFGPFLVGLSTMSAVVSAFALVGVNGLIYKAGNGMSLWMMTSCATAVAYLIIGKKIRAMAEVGSVGSLGDISDLRFNNNRMIKIIMSLILFIGCLAYLSSQIKAGSELLGNLLGMSPLVSGFIVFGLLSIYMSFSGEVGGLLTQAFQGMIMVIAGIFIIVAFFSITGGFGNIMDAISTAGTVKVGTLTKEFSTDMLSFSGLNNGALAFAWIFIPIVGTVGQPQVLTRMYALKNPKDMPKLALWGGLAHLVVAAVSIVVGFAVLYLVAIGKIEPLEVADRAIFAFADYAGIGTQLFVYTAVLAAAMSSASLFLSVCATVISRDLPAAFGKKMKPEQQMKVAKIAMIVVGLASIWFALTNKNGVAILGTFGWGTLMSATFPPFIIGLLWKGATSKGVGSGLVVALILNSLSLFGFKWPGMLPWYVNVLAITFAVTVLVSLVTKEKLSKRVEAAMDI